MDVRFTFDVVCPYAWLASQQVKVLCERAGASMVWDPVLLGGVYKAIDAPQQPADVMSPQRARLDLVDRLRQAERAGVPLVLNPFHPVRSLDVMRLIVAAGHDRFAEVAEAAFRAIHVEGRNLADPVELERFAAACGLDVAVVKDPAVKQELRTRTDAAVDRGVFGVPTVSVGTEQVFGADRLVFVAEALGLSPPERPQPSPSPSRLVWFHDFASPFSYLASTGVEALADRHGAVLERVPLLLGGLFREIGTPDVPMFTYSAPKQAWVGRDLARWAEHRGVDFRFPSTFPLRTVLPLRVAIVAPETTDAIYRAAWVDDRDIGDRHTLAEVLDEAGFDGTGLVAQTGRPEVKEQLFANTRRAIAADVPGVPSFRVDDEVLFWGQDRMDMVEAALAGWRPEAG